jgi:hypothetical protein
VKRKNLVSLRTYASIAAEQQRRRDREAVALFIFVAVVVAYFGAHIVYALVRS